MYHFVLFLSEQAAIDLCLLLRSWIITCHNYKDRMALLSCDKTFYSQSIYEPVTFAYRQIYSWQ